MPTLSALFNSQPCGDSHIPDGTTCHVGGGSPQVGNPQSYKDWVQAGKGLPKSHPLNAGNRKLWAMKALGAKTVERMTDKELRGAAAIGRVLPSHDTTMQHLREISDELTRRSQLGNRSDEPFYKLFNCSCGCGKCPEAVAEEAAKKAADEKLVNDEDAEGEGDEEIENGGYRSLMSAMRNSKACGGSHIADDKECRLEGAKPGEIGSRVSNFLTSNGVKPSWASSAMGYIHRVLSGNNQFIKSASNPKVVVKNGYAAKFTMDAVAVKPDGSEAKGKVSYTFTPNRGIAHKVSFTPDSELSNSRLGSLSCDTVIEPDEEMQNSGTSEGAKKGWESRKLFDNPKLDAEARATGKYFLVHDTPFNKENSKELIGHAYKAGGEPSYTEGRHVAESELPTGTKKWANYNEHSGQMWLDKQKIYAKAADGAKEAELGRIAARHELESDEFSTARQKAQRLYKNSVAHLFNSQPCGDSHIPDGHQCHVGGGAAPTQRTPEVDKPSTTEQKAEERYIATTVLEQIRATDRSALMAWGMRSPTIMPAGKVGEDGYQRGGVQFKVNGGKLGHGIVKVRLMANDTYTVEAGKVRMGQWKEKGKREDVYADNLMEVIDHMIERDRPGYANRYHAALEAMVNYGAGGQPCGGSHIAAGLTCHAGGAR